MMFLDHPNRRVRKATPDATRTYLYDGWNLVREVQWPVASGQWPVGPLATSNCPLVTDYVWGKDLSGSLSGAGGVGGLLAVAVTDCPATNPPTLNSPTHQLFFPLYDANGNITAYVSETGEVVAQYAYDGFGRTLSATGPMADFFRHRFSTKYYDPETGFYYYGYRYYAPELTRWTTRDPIGEDGGLNLYAFCGNNPISKFDPKGLKCKLISGPIIKDDAKWELEKIKFKTISNDGQTLVYGIYGFWRILGEVDCVCTRFWRRKPCTIKKDVYKKDVPKGDWDYSSIEAGEMGTFISVPNPAALPLNIPIFTSINEGFHKILEEKMLGMLQSVFAEDDPSRITTFIKGIESAIERNMPLSSDGTWPKDPCNSRR